MSKLALLTASLLASALFFLPSSAMAAHTASGVLTVTATVVPSIQLLFNSDASGITLTGSGTNAATMVFGSINAYGTYTGASGSTRTAPAANCGAGTGCSFKVASPFDIEVDQANTGDSTCSVTAQLTSADTIYTWNVGPTGSLVNVSDGASHTVNASQSFGSTQYTLQLTVPLTQSTGLSISNSITFTASAA
jgi:hypothetical protein